MAQNTNSAALVKLKPLENTNIGAIVEEHVRYWRKYKDDQEALDMARAAQEAEFQRKLTNNRKKDLPELSVGDAVGMYKDQRVRTWEEEQPEIAKLKQDYLNTGDASILLKLEKRREFYKAANDVTKAAEEYSKYILENKDKEFNPYLDEGKIDVWDSLVKGRFKFGKQGFDVLKNNGEIETYTPQQINEMFLRLNKFSGKPNFETSGKAIAEAVDLKSVNGTARLTNEKRIRGITRWKNQILDNKLQLDSAAAKYGYEKGKPLTEFDVNSIAEKLFNEYTLSDIKETDNSLSNALKSENLKSAREKNKPTTIKLLTDENEQRVKEVTWKGQKISIDQNDRLFTFDGKQPKEFIDSEGNKVQPTNILYSSDGEVSIIGKATKETVENARDENGNIIYKTDKDGYYLVDDNGNRIIQKTVKVKEIGDVRITDDNYVGNVITNIKNPKTNNDFKNLSEAKQVFENIAPTINESNDDLGDDFWNNN
jgi:hypothetical protein